MKTLTTTQTQQIRGGFLHLIFWGIVRIIGTAVRNDSLSKNW